MNGNEDARRGNKQAADEYDRLKALHVESFAHHVDAAHKEHEGDYETEDIHGSILPMQTRTPKSPSPWKVTSCQGSSVSPILGIAVTPELILRGWIERHTRIAPRGRAPLDSPDV